MKYRSTPGWMICLIVLGMTLLDLRIVGASLDANARLKRHALMVAIFLVVAHIAMIFGMLDPAVLTHSEPMMDHSHMMH